MSRKNAVINKWAIARILSAVVGIVLAAGLYFDADRVARYYLSEKQEGDILLQSLPHSEFADAIETATNSEWSHCGILVRKDGEWQVAQAGTESHYTPLLEYIIQGRGLRLVAFRVRGLTDAQRAKIQPGIAPLLHKAYNIEFREDDRKLYCSQLVWLVYDRALGIHVGEWETLGSLNWRPLEPMIRRAERGSLPMNRLMITPLGLTKTDKVERVFSTF